jgi:hypothetical protein
MTPQMLRQALCGAFEISEDEGVLLVRTPFGLDFGDDLVLRVRPGENGWCVDDNGETLLGLTLNGVAPDVARIADLSEGVDIDDEDGVLSCGCASLDAVQLAVFRLAGAALRINGACRPRARPLPSDLKERVIDLLSEVAGEAGVGFSVDQVVEEAGSFVADAVLHAAQPLIVIAATSVERLMEAELLCLHRRAQRQPGYVCAVVPSAKSVGQKHFSRANYFTDKALEFDAGMFREFAQQRVSLH